MKKILIVDDHPVVLEGLALVISNEGYEVIKASDTEEALALSKKEKIDLMVIDLTLKKDADGLSLIKRLKRAGVRAPSIIYTMHEELWNIALLLQAKVNGIVLKGESIDELLEAIKTVGRGGKYLSPIFRDRMTLLESSPDLLTAKEDNIINMIGQGESTGDISRKMGISIKTVEYHRSNIMKKLDARNMTEAIKNAVKLGIITSIMSGTPLSMDAQDNMVLNPVDLGLSVKWADRNLGAESPSAVGGFFAFGETYEKETYGWDTYSHCDNGDMFSQHDFGVESICSTEYDVAFVSTDGKWRMPTLEEVEELMENCTIDVVPAVDDELCQLVFTASNGGSISFPITGYMNNGKLLYSNKETELLTGNMEIEEDEEDGFSYRFNSPFALALTNKGDVMTIMVSSHLGFQVRPVLAEETNYMQIINTDRNTTCVYSIEGRYLGDDISLLPSGIYILTDGQTSRKVIK